MVTRLNIQTSPELANMTLKLPEINWSRHAFERAIGKRVVQMDRAEIKAGQIVEIETENKKLLKVVVRISSTIDPRMDDVIVLRPINSTYTRWLAITCWQNRKTDTHSTLNTSRLSTNVKLG